MKAGDRLPGARTLASELGVARGTGCRCAHANHPVSLESRRILCKYGHSARDRFGCEHTAHVHALPEPRHAHHSLELAARRVHDEQTHGVRTHVDGSHGAARHAPGTQMPCPPICRFNPISVRSSMRAAESFKKMPCSLLVVVQDPGFFTPR